MNTKTVLERTVIMVPPYLVKNRLPNFPKNIFKIVFTHKSHTFPLVFGLGTSGEKNYPHNFKYATDNRDLTLGKKTK